MIVPTPMQYLASHAIAFVAGALTTIAIHFYGKRQRSVGARSKASGTVQ